MHKEVIFEKERIATIERISKEIINDINLKTGINEDDYFKNLMTLQLSGYIYSNMSEERDLIYYCEKPSFLDWLLRRKKRVVFKLQVKDLLLNAPKLDNTQRIYIVN